MKRKLLFVLISIFLITTLVLVACDKTEETREKWGEVYTYETAYAEAKDLGYGGTLQEFIDSIKGNDGEDGQDGIGIKFITINNQGNLIVTLSNDTVIDCGNVKGPQGEVGPQGPSGENGEDGITPQLKIGEDNFWYVSYDKGESWTSLGVKATGNDGENGLTPYVGENGNWFIGDFDTGLQAGFVKDQVVVTFHPNGATFDNTNGLYTKTGDTYTIQLDKGDAIASLPLVELAGYEFKGWKTGKTVNDGYWKNNWTISSNLHLYADLVLIDLGEPDTPEHPDEPIGTEGLEYTVINETEASVSDYTGTATEVTIPSTVTIDGATYTVTTIGEGAFADCDSLTSITIPDSVTSIGKWAFSSCDSLTSIVVDENNQNYKSIDGNLYSKDGSTFIQYAIGKTDTTFTIPDSVASIGESAFASCENLTSITIPDSVTAIGRLAFLGCSSLTICCEAESKPEGWYDEWNNDNCPVFWNAQSVFAQDGITYAITKANFATVGKYFGTATEVTIPSTVTIDGTTYTVTTIGELAFFDCTSLTSITIPNSVTSISAFAFYDCDSLTSVTIPDSVTSIGCCAFQNCTSLTSITIPDSVTAIGYWAFYDCDSLTIHCEAESQPEGWHDDWNYDNRPVVWGYIGE